MTGVQTCALPISVGTSATSDSSGAPNGVNLCDSIDDDDDNDGYLDISYTTVQLCSGYGQTNPGTEWYTSANYPNPPTGDYIAVDAGSSPWGDDNYPTDDSVSCTFTLPAGETLTVTLNTGSYGSEARVTVVEPDGTSTLHSGYASGSINTVGTYTAAGSYTVSYGDSYGDGCNPSTYYGACYVQASYVASSGTDKFQFDSEAWFDTDDDGLTD